MIVNKELDIDKGAEKDSKLMEPKELEELRLASEERRVSMMERQIAAEEMMLRNKQEQRLKFMNLVALYEKGKVYFELMCYQ